MKFSKNVVLAFLVFGLSLSSLPALFAHEGHDDAAFVKVLQDSAAALQASQPALANDLTAFANEEAEEMKEEKNETKEENAAEEAKEAKEKNTPEHQAKRAAHLKLLKDAASALQGSNPELAAKLTKKADRIAKKMAEKK